MTMNIIYLHGLSSSGNSNTARTLRELLPNDNIITPDLPVNPFEALSMVKEIVAKLPKEEILIVGTSMGAMLAHQLKGYRRILVNPAFHVSKLLRENEGKTLQFFSERQDGQKEFEVSDELCGQFEEMEDHQFDNAEIDDEVIAIFGTQDSTCNCLEEYQENYIFFHVFDGGHRMTSDVIEKTLLPLMEWMKGIDEWMCDPKHPMETLISFDDVQPGDTGLYSDDEGNNLTFKIYRKGVGRKWFDEIYRKYNGMNLPDGRIAELTFPKLPEGVSEDDAPLVLGNLYLQAPSIEYYGSEGVQVVDTSVFYANGIKIYGCR